jgi:hypothetical protein
MNHTDCNLNEFLEGFAYAFDAQDMDRILEYFYYPCLLITDQSVTASKNKEEMHQVVKGYARYITGGRVEHQTSYTLTSLIPLDEKNLVISLLWRINSRSGQEVSQFRCSYHLIKKQQEFKIVVIILPEEKK